MATTLSVVYADTGSAPRASSIGWIDWGSYSLTPGSSDSIEISLSGGVTLTFDIENQNISGDAITFTSDTTLANSAFGTIGYTGITEKIAIEPFISYITSLYSSAKFKISNIVVKDNLSNPINGYSIIIGSIQANFTSSTSIYDQQTLFTDGSDWNKITYI